MENTAIKIVETFQKAGHQAYFAGGSVRDLLMGNEPQDYDIATSATPDEIERIIDDMHLGSKSIPIGKEFGVILGIVHGHQFEIATFRSDSSSSDGRRPDAVIFTNPEQDALRRDFTINGLFYDPLKKKFLDYIEGQKDIHDKMVRFIGDPHERIKEDHLRILRAVRFKNNFNFKYDKKTEQALRDLSHLVKDISKERVRDEMTKMLLHPHRASSMQELSEFGIMEHIIPEFMKTKDVDQPIQYHQEGDVMTHLLKSLHDMPQEWATPALCWAVFLHDIAKPQTYKEGKDRIRFDGHAQLSAEMTDEILRRLKAPKALISHATWTIHYHMSIALIPDMRRAHQVDFFLNPYFEDLIRLHWCDEHGSLPIDLSLYERIMKLYTEFKNLKLLPNHFEPKLNGNQVMELTGLEPGPKIAELLKELRHAQIEGDVHTEEEAREFIRRSINK